jgi:hypothetical protein
VDVRRPAVSADGQRVLFAMRTGAAPGLDLYEVAIDGSGCRRVTQDGGQAAGGITIDNFDPLYVTDAGTEWVVYASTRAGARSPMTFLPESDLWRQPLAGGTPERMTFLRGSEAEPGIMADGQLTLVAEKVSPDFYQLAGRRLNWDLSDYHPLLAQRAQNYQGRGGYPIGQVPAGVTLRQSIGYAQATGIREALDGDFLVVLADSGSYAEGGALGIFNRSIGPFEAGRSDPGYVRSLRVLPGPTGRVGDASGAYRSLYPLPDGAILASYADGADIGRKDPVRYQLVVVDPQSGERTPLYTGPSSDVDAVLAYARPPATPFVLHPAPAGATTDTAVVHYPDLPLLASLLDSNNRRGRDVTSLRPATRVRFFTEAPPPAACASPADVLCASAMAPPLGVYEARRDLGSAPLSKDGSAYLRLPAGIPLGLELLDGSGQVIFRTREETQLGPTETIGIGVPPVSFDGLCAVCHGSVSGRELDIHVSVDALTGASATLAHAAGPRALETP